MAHATYSYYYTKECIRFLCRLFMPVRMLTTRFVAGVAYVALSMGCEYQNRPPGRYDCPKTPNTTIAPPL